MPQESMRRPIRDAYVIPETRLVAGEYPGTAPASDDRDALQRLTMFLDAGITAFIDLTDPLDGLAPYVSILRACAAAQELDVSYERLTIRDMDVCDAPHMRRVLDLIDARLAEGRGVYVHCWGGIGRTGTVIGCWLVRHGETGEAALKQVQAHFESMSPQKVRRHRHAGSPQTHAQREMVRTWGRRDDPWTADTRMLDRYRGALLGLAAGDALGTTLEFRPPGSFDPISDIVGGGPFTLDPGQWTDDTSMALCLAESLVERRGFEANDQMQRYVRWWREGYWSSRGECFDIGSTTRAALGRYERTGDPFAGETTESAAGNGSLMRLAPVPLCFARDPEQAIHMAGESSRTTHGARAAVDACRYFAALLLGALAGTSKDELLAELYAPVPDLWARAPLHARVAEVASGSFRRKVPPDIRGGHGFVIDTLEAALWAFATTDNFAAGALAAVNLGGDADTTGAVYGQIAGAYYGVAAIPSRWVRQLTMVDDIDALARRLFDGA